MGTQASKSEDSIAFLPDFCDIHVVLVVILMAELLALILALASSASYQALWVNLALLTLFVQWVALGNVVMLCLNRRRFQELPPFHAALTTYALSLLITLIVSLAALWATPPELLSWRDDFYGATGFVLRNLAIAAIVSAVALRYFYVLHQWRSNIQTEAHARIQALQARIRPHFLFNSMNTIASLTRTDPKRAEKAVEDLADLFRASLGKQEKVKLSEEIQFTKRYIDIEQLRLGDRLSVNFIIDQAIPPNAMVPALILQPLVENAIYHGIEPQTTGGAVNIEIAAANDSILFRISNPVPRSLSHYRRSGNKMAQENIQQRLRLAYGEDSMLRIDKTETHYTVSFTIPIERQT